MPRGYLELPATPQNVTLYPAWAKAKHTAIRMISARRRAPGKYEVARDVISLTGSFTSPAQVEQVQRLYRHHPWTPKFARVQMDIAHRPARIAIPMEALA
jgi:hypothetical protein